MIQNFRTKMFNNKNNILKDSDIFYKVQDLLSVKPMQDILDSLGITYNRYHSGDVIRGKCPDHYIYTGRYPSGDTDWVVNVKTGQTFCHTQKRGSNILLIAKRMKKFQTLQQAFSFISEGYNIQDKFSKFIKNKKRNGFNINSINRNKNSICVQQQEKFNKSINNAKKMIQQSYLNKETEMFFLNDGITIDTVKKFNIVSIQDGYLKYRCLIPFYDHINLNKIVGYVTVNTLSKHQYIKRIGRMILKQKNVCNWSSIKTIYSMLLSKYKKAMYLKNSLMRQNLFGLNILIQQKKTLKEIFVVQGQRDAIKMQQQGFCCVGTHGSHISQQQFEILRSVGVETIYVMFDSDKAGRQGAKKSIQNGLNKGFKMYNIDPLGKDPKKYNRNQLKNIIQTQVIHSNQWDGLINSSSFDALINSLKK